MTKPPRQPGGRSSRWWLDPALARVAFGTTQAQGAARADSVSIGEAMAHALAQGERLDLDLGDPAQRDFGDYELIEQVGHGGMGVVYRARQRGLDREVAIKLLSAGQWASEELVEALRREAQHAARLQHPNIVVVHEMGEYGGLIFYAMQLVRGRSLSQQLDAEGPMPPREAARLLRTVAEAVDYAHRLGVLHLDLKPGNLLVEADGAPRIADFGLARRLEQALDQAHVCGTPSYMAPEQAAPGHAPLSPATDVWALGAVLYELLTGYPPFEGVDAAHTLRLLRDGTVRRPSRMTPVPPDLEAVVMHCLQRDPARRYPSARALADDLGRFLEGRAVSVRPLNGAQRTLRWMRREPKLALAGALAVAALLVGLVATSVQWRRAQHNAAAASASLWESRREAAQRLEVDGKGFDALPRLLANIRDEEAAGRMDLAALDRRRIGVMLHQGAVLVDEMVVPDANPLALEMSEDGALIAIAFGDQSVRWYDTATLREQGRVSLRGRTAAEGDERAPILLRFSGDHHLRATLEWYSNLTSPAEGGTWLIDLRRKAVVAPPAAFRDFAEASFDRDGRYAMLGDRQRRTQLWQLEPWKPLSALGPPRTEFMPWLLAPDGRQALMLRVGMRELQAFRLPDLQHPHSVFFPGNAGISAWMLSHDGRTLALGDFEGRAFLFDLRARELHPLPTSRGREVLWLAFSDDDQWLAVANRDGNVHALDVATGDSLVAGPMHHDFAVQRLGISRAQRLLIAAGDGQTALWRLPLRDGPRAVPAQRIGAAPLGPANAGRYPIGWSFRSGLLATAGLDGRVRLWRLPQAALREARAAHQVSERAWFDGQRLVDVAWDHVRVLSIDNRPLTPWRRLAQPPGFAELVDGGRLLAVTVGPSLQVLDSTTLAPVAAPIALPNSPQRLLAAADGRHLLLSFGAHGPGGVQEQLLLFDARAARRLPGEARVAGPVRALSFSPDGTRLLAVGPVEGATTVFATQGLRRIGEFPHDAFQPVVAADFARRGHRVLLVTRAGDQRLGEDALIEWDPDRDRILAQHATGRARPLQVVDSAGGAFVAGIDQDVLGLDAATPRTLERGSAQPTTVLAVSADGRLLARGYQLEVQLYALPGGEPLGPPLRGDHSAFDMLMQLAFSPDGTRLVARSALGHWLYWRLDSERRSVAELSAELDRIDADRDGGRVVRVAGASARRALRARDPGPWAPPATAPRPQPVAVAYSTQDDLPVPARAGPLPVRLVDLGRYYTTTPDSLRNTFYSIIPALRPYPVGLQRMDGIDYDIRGLVDVGRVVSGLDADVDAIRRRYRGAWSLDTTTGKCFDLPAQPVAAAHALLLMVLRAPKPGRQPLLDATWHYRDGGKATLLLLSGRDVPGYAGEDAAVPRPFSVRMPYTVQGLPADSLSAPRIRNPHPGWPVRCLELRPHGANEPFGLLAITTEPVIAGSGSRTTRQAPAAGPPPG